MGCIARGVVGCCGRWWVRRRGGAGLGEELGTERDRHQALHVGVRSM